ncbi:hypothetical protein LTR12_003180 [Friedmanniomyces endolithicus]|nr:hypothetical protein LTR12_003180 [Friedmanniomyces endolithicus]
MSYGSPVFKTLLGPKFMEGTALATSSTVEIPLPEDNPEHMSVLCNIFHMRNDRIVQLGLPFLANFVNTCDKYACALAVQPTVEGYMLAALPLAGVPTLKIYLGIAMTLRYTDAVRRIAVRLAYQATKPIMEYMGPSRGSTIGPVCARIDMSIVVARHCVSDYIDSIIDEQHENRGMKGSCDARCNVGMSRVFGLLTQLKGYNLWSSTTKEVNLESILRSMETLRLSDPIDLSPCAMNGPYCAIGYGGMGLGRYQHEFGEKASEIRKLIGNMEFPELGEASQGTRKV